MSSDLKEGDEVEISLRCKITSVSEHFVFLILPDNSYATVTTHVFDQAEITKIETPLKEGRAILKRYGHEGWIVHIKGGEAWFRYETGGSYVGPLEDFRNIPEEDGQ